MTRTRLPTLLPLIVVSLFAGALVAGSTEVVSLKDHLVQRPVPGGTDRQDCTIGHVSEMMFAFDTYTAQGGYKYLIQPTQTCDCPAGFHLDSVHTWLVFSDDEVPITFDVYADLEQAVWNEETQCWEPGPELCVSQTCTITIQNPGYNEIEIPILDECDCECMDAWYFLSIHFPEPVPEAVLAMGDAVDACVAYHDAGSGWTDWNDTFDLGCFVLYGDAYCCDSPSPAGGGTWGNLKGLFK